MNILQSLDKLREMSAMLSEPAEVMVEKKLYTEIRIDEPDGTRLSSASCNSRSSTLSQLSSGASGVQAASAKWVDVGVTSSSNTNWPHSFSGKARPQN